MLTEKTKKEVKEMTDIMKRLDDTERMLMMSNGNVLLARQQMSEKKPPKEKQLV